ncbi:hypothetical protein T492DRAFT_1024272 [Pavlovales sp. CCMP2436]|nr:hypothetical protein T492DRAFT_1024272 [Pavlovales sp. CCMP2436]
MAEVIDLFDDAPVGALPKRKVMLPLVDDDSSEEDTLCRRRKNPKKNPKPAPQPRREARDDGDEDGTRGRGSHRHAARAGASGRPRKIVVLDEASVELTTDEQHDEQYLKRQQELARLQTLLHASAAATVPVEEEPEEEVEEVPPPAPAWDKEPPRVPTPEARRKIKLNIRMASKPEPITVNLYANSSFVKLIAKLAEKLGGDPRRARLTFDGDVITAQQTPESLDLEDEDLLDFVMQ